LEEPGREHLYQARLPVLLLVLMVEIQYLLLLQQQEVVEEAFNQILHQIETARMVVLEVVQRLT
jgi:hypothetical protein